MGVIDLLLAGMIIAGALYLLYRSMTKHGSRCSGCSVDSCPLSGQEKDACDKNKASTRGNADNGTKNT